MMDSQDGNQLPPTSEPQPEGTYGESSPTPDVEGYEITGRLGEGGMGTVWSAVQLKTRREVALKFLGKGVFSSEKARARFEREVELTARLHHPNIAQLYDSGSRQGLYYYAMELVDGIHLDRYVEEERLSNRQMLELLRTVCQAVQHAHQNGVIHRDLKPSNILVTPDGQPHLLDFGLAKGFLDKDSRVSVSSYGEAAGTPAYMSPEQAVGNLERIDTRTDVYSLGVILYRLLTGKSPHDLSGSRYEVLRRIAEKEVRRPREIAKDVNRELEALVLKALARDPKDRYVSAGAVAQDIENYLTGEPLTARPPTTAYFLRKRLKKYRLRVAVVSSVLALLIGTAVFAYARVVQERTKAEEARDSLQKEVDKANAVKEFMRSSAVFRDPRGRAMTLLQSLDQIAEEAGTKLAKQPEVEAAVRSMIGDFYVALEQFYQANIQYSRAFELRRRVLGEEHLDTIWSMNNVAYATWNTGNLPKAEAMHRRILALRRRVQGERDRDTLWSMNTLALALFAGGKLDEAEELDRENLRIRSRVYGEKHPETLRMVNNLAVVLERKGELDEAERLHRECFESRRQVLGESHPDTLWGCGCIWGARLDRDLVG